MERGYDFLIVGEGDNSADDDSVMARLTGIPKLRKMTSGGSKIWMKIATDRTGTRRGFKIRMKRVADAEGKFNAL